VVLLAIPHKEAAMETNKWMYASLLGSALLVLLTASGCQDSPTSASSSAAASGINAGVAASMSRDDDDGHDARRFCPAGPAGPGVIAATVTITENTKLTCNVVCTNTTGPCIQFGAPRITLWLNGHTMTGPATPPVNCATVGVPVDGISTNGHDHVRIRGSGMVQQFRRHGIFVVQSERSAVEHVTSHWNCFSGILMALSHRNDITDNVSVRNAVASGGSPCGGNCIVNSNHNRIRRNNYHGNGSIAPGDPTATPNDFGVGLVGSSSNNVIEDNNIGGNINGILLFPATAGNLIRRNIIAGNPPVQVSATAGSPIGVDIRDASAAGANTFRDNHCITYEGAKDPPPCPNFRKSRRGGDID
jgi:parallel beta-helix repeat protein